MNEEFPPKCPECHSNKIDWEDQNEYTGGGYADYWTEYKCKDCEYEWKSEIKNSLF